MKSKGLARKLVIKTGVLTVIIFAVALVILSLVLSSSVKNSSNEILSTTADRIAMETEEFFDLHAAMTEQAALDPVVINFMQDEKVNRYYMADSPLWPTFQKQLEGAYQMHADTSVELYASSWFVNDIGSSTGETMQVDYPGMDIMTRYWMTGPEETGATVFTAPYVDSQTGDVVCTIASPIVDNGEHLGSMCVDFYLNDVRDKLASSKVGKAGYTMVYLADGTVFYHPDEEYMGLDENGDNFNISEFDFDEDLVDAIASDAYDIFELDKDDEEMEIEDLDILQDGTEGDGFLVEYSGTNMGDPFTSRILCKMLGNYEILVRTETMEDANKAEINEILNSFKLLED